MEMMWLGAFGFLISAAVLVAGLLVYIGGLISQNKKTKKVGLNAMLAAAVGLLISFTLCSMGDNRL